MSKKIIKGFTYHAIYAGVDAINGTTSPVDTFYQGNVSVPYVKDPRIKLFFPASQNSGVKTLSSKSFYLNGYEDRIGIFTEMGIDNTGKKGAELYADKVKDKEDGVVYYAIFYKDFKDSAFIFRGLFQVDWTLSNDFRIVYNQVHNEFDVI